VEHQHSKATPLPSFYIASILKRPKLNLRTMKILISVLALFLNSNLLVPIRAQDEPRLQGDTNSSGFFTSATCMSICPENKPNSTGRCETTVVGDCACVYDDDNYCSMGCDNSEWNMMCRRRQPDGPRLQGCETNGPESCTSDTCMSKCPETKPDFEGACDTIVGDCACVYDDDISCSMGCDTSGWNMMCQAIMQPPIDNSDGIDVTTDEGDQETQTTDSDADTDNDTRDETMQESNINKDGDISGASTADSSSRTNFNPHFSVVVSSIAAVVILGILL